MRNKTPIRTGNLIIIVLIILAGIFYFSGWFDKAKNVVKDYQNDKVEVKLKESDSLLSVYMIKTYDLTEELKRYEEIPVGVSRISKDESGNIKLLPNYKPELDTNFLKYDSTIYYQGWNDAMSLNNQRKEFIFENSDTTYWFISYHARTIEDKRVYSQEVISVKGEFVVFDIIKNLEKEYHNKFLYPNK